MPTFERDNLRINYEVHGNGEPVLLIAPGGMRSSIGAWARSPWNPIEALADRYQLIAMDQRNAGSSTAPISGQDGWATYTGDQLALLDHLGIDRFAVVGMCIGGPYIMGLINAAASRVAAAVMLQPIGVEGNRDAFAAMFNAWADEIRPAHPEATNAQWDSFRGNMFGGDFMFNATEAEVAACTTPLLVLMGNDLYHPSSTSRAIARLAPNARLVERWKEGEDLTAADGAIKRFLADQLPVNPSMTAR